MLPRFRSARIAPCVALAVFASVGLAQNWQQRNTVAAPTARNGHGMSHDFGRGISVLFGGYQGTNVARGDTWEWNGFGWAQRNVSVAPPARWAHGMAYDLRSSQTMLFGGYVPATGFANDTWTWNGNTWQQLSLAVAPTPRSYFGMAYDSIRGRVVLFGGLDSNLAYLADTWEFVGSTWQQVTTPTSPSGRAGIAMAYDDTRRQIVAFGGGDGAQVLGDTWTYDASGWTQLSVAGPSPRWQAAIAHDTICGKVLLHGGADANYANNYGDSWTWDGSAWTQLAGTSPAPRHGSSVIFDPQRSQWILWGGRGAAGFLADTWQRASSCTRTMAVVRPPQVGTTALFQYQYPASANFSYYIDLVTAPYVGSYPVPLSGFQSIGLSRVDLFDIYLRIGGFLDATGTHTISVPIPLDNWFAGIQFDVQSVDLNLFNRNLYWANNDLEVTIAAAPPPPVASFTQDRVLGAAPMTVQFTDTSTGAPTAWQWDFDNNGTVDSTQQNPAHTYTQNGIYSVRLVASNLGGSTTSVQTNLINVGPSPNPALNMIEIQPGTFSMGSTAGTPYEQPVRPVTITRTFWIGKFEVTQAQYTSLIGGNPSFHQGANYPNASQRPVERVGHAQAKAYCTALTAAEGAAGRLPPGYVYRLPTEAEWEFCCRAGTTTEWSTGASLGASQANWRGLLGNSLNAYGQTAVVGNYPANPFGLHDMHGNVWEWCLDTWVTGTGYAPGAVSDPVVTNGNFAVCRGGSWHLFSSGDCRSAYRNFYGFAGTSSPVVGFRIVLGPPMGP